MGRKLALVIGNTEYHDPGLVQLRAPRDDTDDFARVLRDPNLCAFDEVRVLLNELSSSVTEAVDEFFDQKKPDDLLVLYFSGHGVRDEYGSLYLAVKNTIRTRLRATGIKSDYIREAMDQSRSKRQIVILDCCNSGAFPQGTKAEFGGPMGMGSALQGYGRYVLMASDTTQFAWEGNQVVGEARDSLFTHFLVRGLEGEADQDADGKISVDDLYDYAFEEISKVTAKQTPTKAASKVEGEFILRWITRLEDIKLVPLPDDLQDEVQDTRPYVREAAVQKLVRILSGRNMGLRRSAIESLQWIAADDNSTRRIAQAAEQAIEAYRQNQGAAQEKDAGDKAGPPARAIAEETHSPLTPQQAARGADVSQIEPASAAPARPVVMPRAVPAPAPAPPAQKPAVAAGSSIEAGFPVTLGTQAGEILQPPRAGRMPPEGGRPAWLWPTAITAALLLLVGIVFLANRLLGSTTPPATSAPTSIPIPIVPASTSAPALCAPRQANWDPTRADRGTKSIMIAFDQEPDQAVGPFSNMTYASWIWQMFGVGPGKWDDKNNLVPYIAAEIPSADNGEISADGLTVTWKLKPCIFWSDGQPITSKDFAFTWKAMIDPGNAPVSSSGWDQITGIDTPDDQTAVIHFKAVYPAWPTLFDLGPNNTGGLLPAHIFEGKTGLEKDPQIHQPTWAGGPFAIKEWVAGDHMTLVRNPNYFGTPAKLDSINIKFVRDSQTGLAALKSGDVDLVVNLAQSDIKAVKDLGAQGIQLRVSPSSWVERLLFNLGTTTGVDGKGKSDVDGFCPFKDVNVRKAIMLGIDRLSFITNYLQEDQSAFVATLWPNSYWTNTSLQPSPYDPNQASQLLDAAGYPTGADGIRAGICNGNLVKFSLGIETTMAPRRVAEVQAIQANLKRIGIEIKPNHVPGGTFFGTYQDGADMMTGKFDMAIYVTAYNPDPDPGDLFLCSGVPSRQNPQGFNYSHLCDTNLDALFAQSLATADPSRRKPVYDQIQQYLYNNVLVVPLYTLDDVYAFAQRVVFPPSSSFGGWAWDAEGFDIR